MADLSPAAQAVLDAYGHCLGSYEAQVAATCSGRSRLAAALRAAATQLHCDPGQSYQTSGILISRLQLLCLANELDPTV
jgi:hypothetical protein